MFPPLVVRLVVLVLVNDVVLAEVLKHVPVDADIMGSLVLISDVIEDMNEPVVQVPVEMRGIR